MTYRVFVDLRQSYESTHRTKIFERTKYYEITKLFKLASETMEKPKHVLGYRITWQMKLVENGCNENSWRLAEDRNIRRRTGEAVRVQCGLSCY